MNRSDTNKSVRWVELAVVVIVSVGVSGLLRLMTLHEPIERDLDIYATIAAGLLDGRSLYSDLLDIKPPGIFLVYTAFQAVVGGGAMLFFCMGAFFSALCGVALFMLIQARTGSRMLAWAGLLLWLPLSMDLYLQANQPNAEVVMNALVALGVALSVAFNRSVPALLGAGICFAFATFVKQALGPLVCLLAIVLASQSFSSRSEWFKRFVWLLAPSAILWLLAWAWFYAGGRGELFMHLILRYPQEYAEMLGTSLASNLGAGLGAKALGPKGATGLVSILMIVVALGVVALALCRRRFDAALVAAWALGVWFAVAAPGHFHAHYFQLWLPLAVVASFLTIAEIQGRGKFALIAAWILGVGLFGLVAVRAAQQWPLPAEQWSREKYGSHFTEYEAFARNLIPMLRDDETVFVWGVQPAVYRILDRKEPTGIANIWLTLPSYGGSYAPRWTDQLMRDLGSPPPDVIVVDVFTIQQTPAGHPVRVLIESSYRTVARSGDRILLAVRSDSALMQRLVSQSAN